MAVLFSIVGIIGLAVKIGLLLKGAGALVESGTQGMVSASFAVPVVAVLFVLGILFCEDQNSNLV